MADNIPTPAAAPAATPTPSSAPAPKPAATPSAAPKPAAAKATPNTAPKAAATPRDDGGRFAPRVAPKKPLGAMKALGTEAFGGSKKPLAEQSKEIIENARKRLGNSIPIYKEPEPPAPVPIEPPAAPVAAEPAPAPVTPPEPAPAAPAKIKLLDKEYSPEELEAELKALREKVAAPAPAPLAPETQPEPAAQAAKPPTPEEIAQRENDWIANTAPTLAAAVTEEQLDTLLQGGPEAVKLFTQLRQTDMARAILLARKTIADGINPVFEQLFGAVAPLAQQQQQLQRETVERTFLAEHQDFVPHVGMCREIAEQLVSLYPQQVGKMSVKQFNAEVARQADVILTNQYRMFNPSAASWREAGKAPAAAPLSSAPAQTPAAHVPEQAPAPARVPVRPPSSTPPLGQPAGGRDVGFQKAVALRLRG